MSRKVIARCFGGVIEKFTHKSMTTKTDMTVSVFLPPHAEKAKVPALYFLSGLTCNEDNFITKAGACRFAAEAGLALICPDTSPRDTGIPEEHGEHAAYDFGSGAGFYVNATQDPWKANYHMYDYIVK